LNREFLLFTDTDECKTGTHTCQTGTTVCNNTQGGYDCDCLTGYYRAGSLTSCEGKTGNMNWYPHMSNWYNSMV